MSTKDNRLDFNFIKSILNYDKNLGLLMWKWRGDVPKNWNTKYAGKIAGSSHIIKATGAKYIKIGIKNKSYLAHHIIWLWMTGEWPAQEVDHKDTNGENNKWTNLRLATAAQNKWNTNLKKSNSSGYKGVYFLKRRGKWRSTIRISIKRIDLGLFDTPEEAHAAYCKAAIKYHGDFARYY